MNHLESEPSEVAESDPVSENPGETGLRAAVVAALKKPFYDPEIPVDIYELGLIYELEVEAQGGRFDPDDTHFACLPLSPGHSPGMSRPGFAAWKALPMS